MVEVVVGRRCGGGERAAGQHPPVEMGTVDGLVPAVEGHVDAEAGAERADRVDFTRGDTHADAGEAGGPSAARVLELVFQDVLEDGVAQALRGGAAERAADGATGRRDADLPPVDALP